MTEEDTSYESISNAELKIDEYPFTVRRLSEDDGPGYLIEYPDVPGCMSDGGTPEEAIVNGKDALRGMLLTMMEFKDPIPEPGSSMALVVPAPLHGRLTSMAEKRHVQPAQVISDALDRQEPAA